MPRLIQRIACFVLTLGMVVVTMPAHAQDALNLPTELYILLNEGVVERYGLGTAGRARITPQDAFVLDFQVAPDGTWLAYRTQEGLYLVDMYAPNASPMALAGANVSVPYARGRGETLAWSADSRALAFTTLDGGGVYLLDTGDIMPLDARELLDLLWSPDGRYLAARAEGNVWWIFRRDDGGFGLTSIIVDGTSAAWFDLTRLIYTPSTGGVILMDMAQANLQTPLLPATRTYTLPKRVDEDAFYIFALQEDSLGRLERITLSDDDDVSAEAIGMSDISLEGVRWSPTSQLLTAFRGGVLALIDARSGEGFTLPMTSASAYGWGMLYPPIRENLPLNHPIHYIAPGPDGIAQVWQAVGDDAFPRTITPAVMDVSEYAITPDGRTLAYVSGGQLWVLNLTESSPQATSLVELGTMIDVAPAFSADGSRIFYRDEQDGRGAGIWVVTIADGATELFVRDYDVAQHYRPRPSVSVSAMVVTVRSSEAPRNGILLVDTTSGEQAFLGNYTRADWLGGSNLLVEGFIPRADIPFTGLHIMDVNNLEEPPFTVFELEDGVRLLDVRRVGERLRLLLQNRPPSIVRVVDVGMGGTSPSLIATIGYITQPRLAPDGLQVIGLTHQDGSLVWLNLNDDTRYRLQSTFIARQLSWR